MDASDSTNYYENLYKNNHIVKTKPINLKSIQINDTDNIFNYALEHIFQPFFGKTVEPNNVKDKLLLEFISKTVVIIITNFISDSPISVKFSNTNNSIKENKSIIVDYLVVNQFICKTKQNISFITNKDKMIDYDISFYKNYKHKEHTTFKPDIAKLLSENNTYIKEKILKQLVEIHEPCNSTLECIKFLEIMPNIIVDDTTYEINANEISSEIMWAHMVLQNLMKDIIKIYHYI